MLLETKPEVESSRLAPFYSLPAAVAKVVIVALALLIPLDATECLAQAGAQATPQVKPVGVVTQITTGSMTLHTDGGQDVAVQLPDGVSVLRVPPGAKDLKSAAKMSVSDINAGELDEFGQKFTTALPPPPHS